MNEGDAEHHDLHRQTERPPATDPPIVESISLFGDRKEIHIRHDGELYRLRVTRNGKLILNK